MKKIPDHWHQHIMRWCDERRTLKYMAKMLGTHYGRIGKVIAILGVPYNRPDRSGANNPNYKGHWVKREATLRRYCRRGLSLAEMSRKFHSKPAHIRAAIENGHIPYKPWTYPKGKKHKWWNGGVMRDKDGYILVHLPSHPYANKNGYIRKHRLVMEKKLKRYLRPREVVHHRDDNHENNRLKNLKLYPNNAAHLAETLKGKCPNWTPAGKLRIKNSRRKHDPQAAM